MKIDLEPGEEKTYAQTVLYVPPNGGKYNGVLTVTNKRLLYDAKFDISLKGMLEEVAYIKWGSEGLLEIDKQGIADVQVEKKLLSKKCIVTLQDGSKHIFDAGALGIDKCAEAIQAK